MSPIAHILFLASVGLATAAQSLTGFAFALVLLGLTGLFMSLSLGDMANVVNLLTLVNALVALQRGSVDIPWRMMRPAFCGSLAGVAGGVLLLGRLDGRMMLVGQVLLGIAILVCSLLLVVRVAPRTRLSSRASFLFYGGVSGLMGGLFSSSGPPMVFHMYRQPLPLDVIRNSLVVVFAANSALRLGLVGVQGSLNPVSLMLALEALPVVVLVTWMVRRYVPMGSLRLIKRVVFVLLWLAGMALLLPAAHRLL